MPVVNYALIGLIALGFVFQLSLGREVEGFIRSFGFVPAELSRVLEQGRAEAIAEELTRMWTSLFLHGGWFHVAGNLLYLRVFGDNVEDRLGHAVFLLFFLLSGAAGALGQYWVQPNSGVPMIGASGAIAGVLGVYVVLFPAARVVTLFPVFIFLTFIEVPAFVFLGIWALQQLLNGYLVLGGAPADGGVAWFAHLGGFALGIVVGLLFRLLGRRR